MLTTVPSMKARLEPRMVAASTHGAEAFAQTPAPSLERTEVSVKGVGSELAISGFYGRPQCRRKAIAI